MGGKRNAHRVLQGKPVGQRPLGRLRHTQENNIKAILNTYNRRECTG